MLDLLNFVVLIVTIHYLYVFFSDQFNNLINNIFGIYDWLNRAVYGFSHFLLSLLVPLKSEGQRFIFENKNSIDILFPCTGIQPMLQFAMILLLYPGPWKHKLWYIPMGMMILFVMNVFRLFGLGIVMAKWPEYWQYAHDYPARVLIYLVTFILWLYWNYKYYHGNRKSGLRHIDSAVT